MIAPLLGFRPRRDRGGHDEARADIRVAVLEDLEGVVARLVRKDRIPDKVGAGTVHWENGKR